MQCHMREAEMGPESFFDCAIEEESVCELLGISSGFLRRLCREGMEETIYSSSDHRFALASFKDGTYLIAMLPEDSQSITYVLRGQGKEERRPAGEEVRQRVERQAAFLRRGVGVKKETLIHVSLSDRLTGAVVSPDKLFLRRLQGECSLQNGVLLHGHIYPPLCYCRILCGEVGKVREILPALEKGQVGGFLEETPDENGESSLTKSRTVSFD